MDELAVLLYTVVMIAAFAMHQSWLGILMGVAGAFYLLYRPEEEKKK